VALPIALAAFLIAVGGPLDALGDEQATSPTSDDEIEQWRARLERLYAHYEEVGIEVTLADDDDPQDVLPQCPAPEDVDFFFYPDAERLRQERAAALARGELTEEFLAFEPWTLRASLEPPNGEAFSPATLVIRRLAPGVDGYAVYRRAVLRGCSTDKASQFFVQWGPYWIELWVRCSSGARYRYEIADLLAFLAEDSAYPAVEEVVYSPCGDMDIEFKSAADIAADAAVPRSYWGLRFPDVRREAIARSRSDPSVDSGSDAP
jgi:hypothetical protein